MFLSPESKPDLFKVGLIMANFSEGGTVPVDREDLMMEVSSEMLEGRQALTMVVGVGSRWHVEELDLVISLKMRFSVWRLTSHRTVGGYIFMALADCKSVCTMLAEASCSWMVLILELKTEHYTLERLLCMEVSGCASSLFIVEKRVLVFPSTVLIIFA